MVRVFFSVDAHGSTGVWKKWLTMHEFNKADVLMLCGDLTGKSLVPLIQKEDGSYFTNYFGFDQFLKTETEVKEMERQLSNSGVYSFRASREEVEELKVNPEKVEKMIKGAVVKRIGEWTDILVERIDTKKVMTIVMPGNDDYFEIDNVIKSYEDKGVVYPLHKVIEIAGIETISLDYVNPTPWDTPREASEKDLTNMIEREVMKLSDPMKSIFNFHCPPYGTKLDLAPELDKNLKPVTVAGSINMIHVGSKAVRAAHEKYQPMIGVHGHIHESYGEDKIRNTPVLNAGSEYGESVLRGFIIEILEKKIKNYWKVEG